MRGKRVKKISIRRTLTVLAAGVFLVSAGLLVRDLARSARERRANEQLAQLAAGEAAIPAAPPADDGGEERPPERNYLPLVEQNSDMAAWLQIPDTEIDYPVMYTPEDPEHYLHRAFDGSSSVSGCLFVGEGSAPDSSHVMIYGHCMRNGTMFGSLEDYADPAYAEAHPVIRYDVVAPDGTYHRDTYEVMAAFYSRVYRTDETGVFRFYYCADLSAPEDFDSYVAQVEEAALYDTGVTAAYGDRLLTLVTCDYYTSNGRFVLVARASGEEAPQTD